MRKRLSGLLVLGARRMWRRLVGSGGRRLMVTVLGVGLAIGLVVTITGVSVGLATETSVYGAGVDYWIVPETASASTMAVSVGGPSLGEVHSTNEQITTMDGVEASSPVALELFHLQHGNTGEYIIVAGVIVDHRIQTFGIDTQALQSGDPVYENGTYGGPWTGEIVLSAGAADLLDVGPGDTVTLETSNRSFHVVDVANASTATGGGTLPVGVVHLGELQMVADRTAADSANQFLVQTDTPRVKDDLESIYPETRVIAGGSGGMSRLADSELALAMALAALLIAVIVGTLFVATTMGMEINGDRQSYAMLQALGYSSRSIVVLVAFQTVSLTIIGGALGVGLGFAGIYGSNALTTEWLGAGQVASFDPLFIPYGMGVAVVIAVLTGPYLAWLVTRKKASEDLEV